MWDNGSPNAGGSSGGGGSPAPATPATPATPARCTAPGTTRATLNRHAQKVWLQAVDQLSTTCADATQISGVIQSRLQTLFNLVATRVERRHRIQVIWTTNISSETVGSRDIVIYFVNWYAPGGSGTRGTNGVVERYLRERQAATGDSAYGSLRRAHFDNRATPTEGGMCICDTDNTPPATRGTSCCEVYADRMISANAIPDGVANRGALVNNQGFAMAGMAFHEAMHNKIDPFKGASWDLHGLSGGGLAQGNFGGGQQHTTADIREMGSYVNRVRGQYILQAAAPATTAPATPATPGSATPATPGTTTP